MNDIKEEGSLTSHQKSNSNPNKLLAFAQRRIPYIPELKSYCGSVCASIIMQQLEYWFVNQLQGFYKFMSPCQHAKYRVGDSWTEELNLTLREFRGGFDKIGMRYKSKSHFLEVVNSSQDPFQKQYYLSYIDVRSGLTIYLRNHEKIDQLLSKLLKEFSPSLPSFRFQPADIYRDAESVYPEMTNVHIQRCVKRISRDAHLSSRIKETKMNNKEYTKKTAAILDSKNHKKKTKNTFLPIPNASAAVVNKKKLNGVEKQIGNKLTEGQKKYLQHLVPGLMSFVSSADREELENAISRTLCDRESFTRAGYDFFKKLNTIQKAIRHGQWQIPIEITEKEKIVVQNRHTERQQQWRELYGEYQQLEQMIVEMHRKGDLRLKTSLQAQRQSCFQRLKQLECQTEVRGHDLGQKHSTEKQ